MVFPNFTFFANDPVAGNQASNRIVANGRADCPNSARSVNAFRDFLIRRYRALRNFQQSFPNFELEIGSLHPKVDFAGFLLVKKCIWLKD